MKHFSITVLLLAFIIPLLPAQDGCSSFFPFTEGAVMEYAFYNKKDKLESRVVHEISAVENTDDGGVEAQIASVTYDKKGEQQFEGSYSVNCQDDVLQVDVTSFMSPAMTESFSHMEMEIKGDALRLPSQLEVGQTLPDARTEISAGTGGMKILTITFEVTDRKVEAMEQVETDAGTFDCYKVSHTMNTKMLVRKTFNVVEWYAEGIGVVRSETYDKKGRVESSMELLNFEKS